MAFCLKYNMLQHVHVNTAFYALERDSIRYTQRRATAADDVKPALRRRSRAPERLPPPSEEGRP